MVERIESQDAPAPLGAYAPGVRPGGFVFCSGQGARNPRLPFGGEKTSGIGREGGAHSREFFTDPRAVVIQTGR